MKWLSGFIGLAAAATLIACSESPEARQQREQAAIVEATQLLAEKKFSEATTKLTGLTDSTQVTDLRRQATEGTRKAEAERRAAEAAAEAMAIKSRLEGLSVSDLDSMDDVNRALAAFRSAEGYLNRNDADDMDEAGKALRASIRTTLSRKQSALFPKMRSTYARHLAQTLWENDVEVVASGGGNKRIRFIAGMFAANRNIASAQNAAAPMLRDLRFSRSQYEWYRGSEYTYYDMDPEADGHVPE